jgi:hypothetical protein
MTAGNNGVPPEEQDDPFAYLYRTEGDEATGGGAAAGQTGVPRRSFTEATRVGESSYGYPQRASQQQPPPYESSYEVQYHQQNQQQQQHQGQQQQPQGGGAEPGMTAGQPGGAGRAGGRGGGGGRSKGPALAVAGVVAAVAIGITVAVMNMDDEKGKGGANPSGSVQAEDGKSSDGKKKEPASQKRKKEIPTLGTRVGALDMKTTGGASLTDGEGEVQGRQGKVATGLDKPGSGVLMKVKVDATRPYELKVLYANGGDGPATKANATLVVNGVPVQRPISMHRYPGTPWKTYFDTFATVNLKSGVNVIELKCASGNVCSYNVDQMWVS